ncbi:MAG: hypothetical protein JWP34_1462 [Massilia sp.]|nr:hypothetical protein [Massilia sp.]
MVEQIEFVTNSDLVAGLQELLNQLEKRTELREPIKMFIAGGMATHLYTQDRVTTDVDAEFSKRILLPRDLVVETKAGNMLYLDPTYNSTFALMHERYLDDVIRTPLGTEHIEVYVLSPVDLIVSKIARYNGPDPQDIESLITRFGITAEEIEKRAEEALVGYVGNVDYLRMNLRDVLDKARKHTSAMTSHNAPET